jgi:UDP-glucose 4-epimerase
VPASSAATSSNIFKTAEVRVLDNLCSGFKHNLAGFNCDLIEGSILDRELVRRVMQDIDYVFHLAAMISVPESMQKPVGQKLKPRSQLRSQ